MNLAIGKTQPPPLPPSSLLPLTPSRPVQTSIDLTEQGAGVERRKIIMSIKGMDCPSCAIHVTKALNSILSVAQAKVNLFAGEATLMYHIGTISPDSIAQCATNLTGLACKFKQELREGDLQKTLWVSVPINFFFGISI
jgi:Cu2+-exporting ATPase